MSTKQEIYLVSKTIQVKTNQIYEWLFGTIYANSFVVSYCPAPRMGTCPNVGRRRKVWLNTRGTLRLPGLSLAQDNLTEKIKREMSRPAACCCPFLHCCRQMINFFIIIFWRPFFCVCICMYACIHSFVCARARVCVCTRLEGLKQRISRNDV